ncbi:MAG TPA: hypothetical protein VN721_05485 [Flavipsychrobacter sp.]|nr:hypothetical protein [Flavipsychrobacter sp.]
MKKLIFLFAAFLLCYSAKAQTFKIVNSSCDPIVVEVQAGSSTSGCSASWFTKPIILSAGTTSPTFTTSTMPWSGSSPSGSVVYLNASVAGNPGPCHATIVQISACGSPTGAYTTCYCSGSYTVTFSTDASGNVTLTVS